MSITGYVGASWWRIGEFKENKWCCYVSSIGGLAYSSEFYGNEVEAKREAMRLLRKTIKQVLSE